MIRSVAVLCAIALPACLGPEEVEVVPPGAQPVAIRQIAELDPFRFHGGITTRERAVIRDQAEWSRVWSELVSVIAPTPPVPAVDFERDMLVVAAMGTRPTGGYEIRIEAVYRADDQLYVVVEETSPASGCIVTQALTAPVAGVRIERSSLPVAFVNRARVRDCN